MLLSIPPDYAEYIKSTGSFECLTHEDAEPGYVVLWPFDEIPKNNSDVEIEMYSPGFIAFGGNGGGELLVFDDRRPIAATRLIVAVHTQYWKTIGADQAKFRADNKTGASRLPKATRRRATPLILV